MKWLFVLFPSIALAGGGFDQNTNVEASQSVKQSVGVDVAGSEFSSENLVEGSNTRAYAFSYGLGDVDIADCLASVQFGTILFSNQGVKLNKWCAAEIYDAKGLHEMAARMRCDIKEVAKHFATNRACVEANEVTILPIMAPQHNSEPAEDEKCRDDCEDQLEQVNALAGRVAALESHTEAEIRRIQSRPQRVEVNRGITEEQKRAIAEVLRSD